MAFVEIDRLVESKDYEFKRALEAAVEEVAPHAKVDRDELFRAFKRAVRRKFSSWARVDDRFIRDWEQ